MPDNPPLDTQESISAEIASIATAQEKAGPGPLLDYRPYRSSILRHPAFLPVQVEPEEIRRAYQETVRRSIDELAREADARQISHALVPTDRPYLEAIEAYLGFRGTNVLFQQ